MSEESSTDPHLSVAMTTTNMSQITGGNMAPSSNAFAFYFHCALVATGVIGTATNGLILYALVASKQHKKHVLIVNQNVLDLFTCLFIVITSSLNLCKIHLTGSVGYWLCILFLSDFLIWCGANGSVINLASITVDRYLKVVHSTWSKTKLRNWMIYSAMAFSWIGSFTYNAALVFSTTVVIDGACYAFVMYASDAARIFEFFVNILSFYVIILLIFIFCYWRILIVIRRQASVMASHAAAGPSTAQSRAQAQYHHMEANVTKTMISVCAFYAISWLPMYVFLFNIQLNPNHSFIEGDGDYYLAMFIAFSYMCTNSFVYATKFDPVKEVLLRLIPCKKNSG